MSAETEKEIHQLKKRFMELAEKSWRQNQYCFTGFLTMAQVDVFYQVRSEFPQVPYTLSGGRENCERQMIRFGSAELLGYEEEFPIACVEIKPLLKKFADELTHRDYLGACMNLGIERSTLGDIVLLSDAAYLFCTRSIAPFVIENLTKIKHTNVKCSYYEGEIEDVKTETKQKEFQVPSERLDVIVAKVYAFSRGQSLDYFREKKVFVNGRIQENNSSLLKKGDSVTVRGFGKFNYLGMTHITKKGKYNICVEVF